MNELATWHPALLNPVTAVLVVLLGLLLWRTRRLLPWKHLRSLVLLRSLAVGLFVLILFDPACTRQIREDQGWQTVILADASASMLTLDTDDSPRISVMEDRIREYEERMQEDRTYSDNGYGNPLTAYSFGEAMAPLDLDEGLDLLPGLTAGGDALLRVLAEEDRPGRPLGAVLFFSDGASHTGSTLLDAARVYRIAGIPVSVVGMGETQAPGDVAVRFARSRYEGAAGEPLPVNVEVANTGSRETSVTIEILSGETVLAERQVSLSANDILREEFNVLPSGSGFQTWRARISGQRGDLNPATDVSYAAVDIDAPQRARILYLGLLGWEFRFLQNLFREDPQLALDGLIRAGPGRFLRLPAEGEGETVRSNDETTTHDGPANISAIGGSPLYSDNYDNGPVIPGTWPETVEPLMEWDAVIVDSRVLAEWSVDTREGLTQFAADRGGGLLLTGPLQPAVEALETLLPARNGGLLLPREDQFLELDPDPLFREEVGGPLFRAPGVYLPSGLAAYAVNDLARGARIVAETRAQEQPILVLHAYGAGRVAFSATPNTWRWALGTDSGVDQHARYWSSLLQWLALGGKERLETALDGTLQPLDDPLALDLELYGGDFRPRSDARVAATVTAPDGRLAEVFLNPSLTTPGRYEAQLPLALPGEYRVDYAADLEDGETLTRTVWFTAAAGGLESTDIAFREADLRDLARLTGGRYYTWQEQPTPDSLPVAPGLPTQEETLHWARTPPFIILLLALLAAEWFIRRRSGLK